MKRAMIDATYVDPTRAELLQHPRRDPLIIVLGVVSAADPGLIGDDDGNQAYVVRGSAQVEDSGQEFELLDPVDVISVDVDDAITIEKECRIVHLGPQGTVNRQLTRTTEPSILGLA